MLLMQLRHLSSVPSVHRRQPVVQLKHCLFSLMYCPSLHTIDLSKNVTQKYPAVLSSKTKTTAIMILTFVLSLVGRTEIDWEWKDSLTFY